MISRFSSRRQRLDRSFLTARLQGAQSYDRIAGYFSSSLLEVAGEAIDSVSGKVRVVCNSDLDPHDVEIARAAALSSLRQEWCASQPEALLQGVGAGTLSATLSTPTQRQTGSACLARSSLWSDPR